MGKKYDYISFLTNLHALEQHNVYNEVLDYAINLPQGYEYSSVAKFFENSFEDGSLSIIKDRLDLCTSCAKSQVEIMKSQKEVLNKLQGFINNIKGLLDILNEVVKQKTKDVTDTTGTATSYKSYDEKTTELQGRLGDLEQKIQVHENSLNDKLFTLIVNTVAILGIFVAVAFAGFGANTIFSNIIFDSRNDTLLNTYYLCLTGLFTYNLLFLLFYCIFKIVEKLSSDNKLKFIKHCWAFLIIDMIGLIATILLFINVI